jgi:hypothetical protein
MQRLKRENLFAVLEKTGWKIKGIHGAAELLGVKPTTLVSRIEKMGLEAPFLIYTAAGSFLPPATNQSAPFCWNRASSVLTG